MKHAGTALVLVVALALCTVDARAQDDTARPPAAEPAKKGNAAMKKFLDRRLLTGCTRGSWDPIGAWGADGGRVCATATMIQMFEVYYRFPRRGPTPGK